MSDDCPKCTEFSCSRYPTFGGCLDFVLVALASHDARYFGQRTLAVNFALKDFERYFFSWSAMVAANSACEIAKMFAVVH